MVPRRLGRPGGPARRRLRSSGPKLPRAWVVALRPARRAATWQLAIEILFAELERRPGDRIALSTLATWMPRNTRLRAMRELAGLGLITITEQGERRRPFVVKIHVD
jgi:hypothetical protein